MKYIAFLIINLILMSLSACGISSSAITPVTIGYLERQALAPARWTFKPETELVLTAYQWRFSDEGFALSESNQQANVTHVFQRPGVYRVRLEYQTDSGVEGATERDILVAGGTIAGKVLAAADTLVDRDTRDPLEPNLNNDSFATAQALGANSRLAGIVDENDEFDYYQVQLQQYQQLKLQVADTNPSGQYEIIKLALFLSEDLIEPVLEVETDQSTGSFPATVLVPDNGRYFIKLSAINAREITLANNASIPSHGIYSLYIEPANESASAEFALGEVNILLKPNRQYQAQGMSSKKDLGRFKNLSLNNARSLMATANILYPQQVNAGSSLEQQRWETLQVVEILSQHDDILFAEPNWKRYPSAAPVINDPLYPSQWHYETINVPQAWQALGSLGSDSVVVAVIDTGVLTAHPDLAPNLIAGYDYVSSGFGEEDSDANDPGDKSINGQRSSFHGTHVAGTIAAAANDIGGTGVAPKVKIMPVRVLGQGGGFSSDIIAGVCFAAQLDKNNQSACKNNNSSSIAADIINLSLGGLGFSAIEQTIYDAVIEQGIIVIAAAGNESSAEPKYPAAYDKVISVAAIGQTLAAASYSNFGASIDVAAPGGDFSVDSGVLSSWGDDLSGPTVLTYGSLQGTSMAAPHVAGVAALMKSAKASLTHVEFLTLLNAGSLTHDLGAQGRDDIFGHGLIDAHKALLQVQQNSEPQILSSNNNLLFNVSQSNLRFILSAGGVDSEEELGDIIVQVVGADKDNGDSWLTLDKTSGLGTFTASTSRVGLTEGRYNAAIVVSSSRQEVEDLSISVTLQIGNAELSANAGVQYVLLVDENAEVNQAGALVTAGGSSGTIAQQGEYHYQVYNLKKGRYTVSTGSDLDLDNIICDAGESCGQYPILGEPKIITISEDQPHVEVNMSVNYMSIGRSNMSTYSSIPRSIKPIDKQPIIAADKKLTTTILKTKNGQ